MKIIFHVNIHDRIDNKKVSDLVHRAESGEIYLLMESRNMKRIGDDEEFLFNINGIKVKNSTMKFNGIESLTEQSRNNLFIASLYDSVNSESGTLESYGGNRAKLIFFNFIIVVVLNKHLLTPFDLKEYIHHEYIQKIAIILNKMGNIPNDDYITEITAMKLRDAIMQTTKGIPKEITFEFIKDYCQKLISLISDETEENFIVRNTILEREIKIAENINELIKYITIEKERQNPAFESFPNEIHIIIGAAHLMPYLSNDHLTELKIDNSFINYHENIKSKRLLKYISLEYFEEYIIKTI